MPEKEPKTPQPAEPEKTIEKQVVEKAALEKLPKLEKFEKHEKWEKLEHKEKPEKYEQKEWKEKVEKYEHKFEAKEKPEKYEHKFEAKEIEKVRKDIEKFVVESPPETVGAGDPVEQRLAALEQTIVSLYHFITAGQRPDLSRGALANEPGLPADSGASE